MKKILFVIAMLWAFSSKSQSIGYLRYDTVKIMKQGGSGELALLNSTRDSLGFLANVGGGKTQFKRVRKLNDSTLIFAGDTITIQGSGSGSVTSLSQGYGITLTPNPIVTTGTVKVDTTDIHTLNYYSGIFLRKANNLSDVSSASTSRTNLGATTVGSNFFTATNPSAVTWPRVNADNTITFRSAANTLSDLGGLSGSDTTSLSNRINLKWSIGGDAPSNAVSNFFGRTNNASLRFRTNNVERMIIDSIGLVGIGKTNPQVTLDVNGNILVGGGSFTSLLSTTYSGISSGTWSIGDAPGDVGTPYITGYGSSNIMESYASAGYNLLGGAVTVANLAGSGTRWVVANSSGVLSTQTLAPTSTWANNGDTTISSIIGQGGSYVRDTRFNGKNLYYLDYYNIDSIHWNSNISSSEWAGGDYTADIKFSAGTGFKVDMTDPGAESWFWARQPGSTTKGGFSQTEIASGVVYVGGVSQLDSTGGAGLMVYAGNGPIGNTVFINSKAGTTAGPSIHMDGNTGKIRLKGLNPGASTDSVVTWNATTNVLNKRSVSDLVSGSGVQFSDTSTTIATKTDVVNSRPYKVYTALLSQSGGSAPTATVLENTLGGTVVWSYNSNGDYTGTLVGAFTVNKTWVMIAGVVSSDPFFGKARRIDADNIGVLTIDAGSSGQDDALSNTPIEIRVYNAFHTFWGIGLLIIFTINYKRVKQCTPKYDRV